MPRVATQIPDVYESVIRPIALTVTRQVAVMMGWPETIDVLFPGDAESAPMTGSTLKEEPDPSKFSNNGRIRVEITENPYEERILATAVHRREHLPVFVEQKLGIKIAPVYSGTEMIFDFSFRAPNRVLAKRFRDDVLMKTAVNRQENLHELTYHYGLPPGCLLLLEEIHQMREAVAGYGENFSKWISDHITPRATNITTLIGSQQQLVIRENQISPLGWFGFIGFPEPEDKNDGTGTYKIDFQYHLMFDKPVGLEIEWPLMVHNQLIVDTYRDTPNASGVMYDPAKVFSAPSLSRFAFDRLTNAQPDPCARKFDGVVIPVFDEWEPAVVHPSTSSLVTVMLQVDLEDRRAILDLDDLGDYQVDTDILAFLRTESAFLTQYGNSVVHIALYREKNPLEDGLITIDSNLSVRSVMDLDPRQRYHLRISLVHDLFSLSAQAQERFRAGGQAALKILETLQLKLVGKGYLPNLLGGRYVTRSDFNRIAQRINDLKTPHQTDIEYRFLTIGNFVVATHRASDYANHPAPATSTPDDGSTPGTGGGTILSRCDG